ncbi:hypothetical protein Tco_0397761 [Tanacetum coccineum]
MRELREDTFSEGKNNDAHEHVDQVLLEPLKGGWTDFPQEPLIPGISLRKLSSKVTVRHPRPLSSLKTSVTSSKKAINHDTRLRRGIMTCFTSAQLTTSITIRRNIDSDSSNSEGITTIVSKLDNLCRDMKKLKENVRAIQVGCQTCGGAHLDKECLLNEAVKSMEEVKYENSVKTLANEVDGRTNGGKPEECKAIYSKDGLPLYMLFYYSPKEIEYFSANSGFSNENEQEAEKAEDVVINNSATNIKQAPQKEKKNISHYVKPYEPPILFPKRLEQYAKEALVHETMETNKPRNEDDEEFRMNPKCSALLRNQLPPKEQDPRSFILPYSIRRLDFNKALADLGASISIVPFSMYKRLWMGKLEHIDMIIEMADNTKRTPKGIDFRMPITLGRPLLATTHATVNIFRKSISLKMGNEKVIFKMRHSFVNNPVESVRAIKSKDRLENDDLKNIDYDLFLYEFESCGINQLLAIDPDIFTYEIEF